MSISIKPPDEVEELHQPLHFTMGGSDLFEAIQYEVDAPPRYQPNRTPTVADKQPRASPTDGADQIQLVHIGLNDEKAVVKEDEPLSSTAPAPQIPSMHDQQLSVSGTDLLQAKAIAPSYVNMDILQATPDERISAIQAASLSAEHKVNDSKLLSGSNMSTRFTEPSNVGRFAIQKPPQQKRRIPSEFEIAQSILNTAIFGRIGKDMYLYREDLGYYKLCDNDEINRYIMNHAGDKVAAAGRFAALKGAGQFITYDGSVVELRLENRSFVCFRNGVFDFSCMQMRTWSPEFHFVSRIEAAYFPGLRVPIVFTSFLSRCFNGNQALIQRTWEMIGYLLSPDMGGKCFFLLQGRGDSGKSVLGNVISQLFSETAVANLDIVQFGEKYNPSMLRDKKININMDLPSQVIRGKAISVIKLITGNDAIVVERKYKDPESVRIPCKLLFGSNHELRIEGDDPAFFRRMVVIPFVLPVPKEEQDPLLLEKLLNERDLIVSTAIQKYFELKQRNYCFSGAQEAEELIEELTFPTDKKDDILGFLESCCYITEESVFTPTRVLYDAFCGYCAQNGVGGVVDMATFSKLVKERYSGHIHRGKRRVNGLPLNGYTGICLK